MALEAYEGYSPYIFVSYAHKDKDRVLPILENLQENGMRLWFDQGIEAGTEWPEYIEDHLERASTVLVFMTPSTVASQNCRNEINLAIACEKEVLVAYLEDTKLAKGMSLQLSSRQAIFYQRSPSHRDFLYQLVNAPILQSCRSAIHSSSVSSSTSSSSSSASSSGANTYSSGRPDFADNITPNMWVFTISLLCAIGFGALWAYLHCVIFREDILVHMDSSNLIATFNPFKKSELTMSMIFSRYWLELIVAGLFIASSFSTILFCDFGFIHKYLTIAQLIFPVVIVFFILPVSLRGIPEDSDLLSTVKALLDWLAFAIPSALRLILPTVVGFFACVFIADKDAFDD